VHSKNVRSSLRKLFDKLKLQHKGAPAGSSSTVLASIETDEDEAAEDSDEKTSPKKPVTKKAATPKKGVEADDDEAAEESDEKKSPKKAATKSVTKKGTVTKKTATPKKGVGKTTAPKKAGAGGPKTPAKAKGKKGKVEPEADAEGEDEATKNESGDEKMKEADEDGKLPQSLTSINERPLPVAAEGSGMLVTTSGQVFSYTPRDVEVAKSHEVTLIDYLIWKAENNYDFYLDRNQNNSASQDAAEVSDKV
jgi:hypothetical protein